MEKDTIRLKEVAELTGLAPSTLYIYCHKGKIPYWKSRGGKTNYFSKKEIIEWMRSERMEAI